MKHVGVIGLGDMGSGLAKNLLAAGFSVLGHDLSDKRMAEFVALGGTPAASVADVGAKSEAVFVMVMTGDQAKDVILGDGLLASMQRSGIILLTATIRAAEAREIAAGLDGSGLLLVDSPVSGGFPGAQSGTLTMMAAGSNAAMEKAKLAMEAVSATIHRVGDQPGMGQTVKACLQSLIGSIFAATFEASVLAAKSGVSGQVLYDVISTSGAGCGVANTALANIIDGAFEGTGSHINTMYKDLTIAMDMAREQGVPLFTASTAMQLFQAGKTRHPDGDNWVVTRVLEEISGASLRRAGA
jgi:3-hydroxyisobutyrate dehydrogenase-like beta-hydroxyacid dehydrogenase